MWPFPPRRPATPDAATDPLHAQWKAWLALALSRQWRRTVDADAAVAQLRGLTAARLVGLDPLLRAAANSIQVRWYGARPRLAVEVAPAEDRDAFLFVAGCDPSGHLREQALGALRAHPGRFALALALIRGDDWVDEVRAAALTLLREELRTRGGAPLLEFAELLLVLRARQRFSASAWPEVIEPALRHPDLAAACWEATRAEAAAVRRFACELIERSEPEQRARLYRQAAADPSPRIARWALGRAGTELPTAEALSIARDAVRHPHASVRAAALRQWVALDAPGSRDTLETVLFDRSASTRGVAAYWLPRLHGLEPRAAWRAAIDAGDSPRARAALLAMGEAAQPEDEPRLAPWLAHAQAWLRLAALRALVRARTDALPGHLRVALRDSSLRVVRLAVAAGRSEPDVLTPEGLREAYRSARPGAISSALLQAMACLPKWESLALLLELLGEVDAARTDEVVAALWYRLRNYAYAPINEARRARVEAALAAAEPRLSSGLRTELLHTLKYS